MGAFGEGISTWMGRLTKGPPPVQAHLSAGAPQCRHSLSAGGPQPAGGLNGTKGQAGAWVSCPQRSWFWTIRPAWDSPCQLPGASSLHNHTSQLLVTNLFQEGCGLLTLCLWRALPGPSFTQHPCGPTALSTGNRKQREPHPDPPGAPGVMLKGPWVPPSHPPQGRGAHGALAPES